MYRPKDWGNPYKPSTGQPPDVYFYGATYRDAFEAGADAMLEGLLNSDEPSCEVFETTVKGITGEESGPIRAYGEQFPGKLVFIPDEQVKKEE